MKNIGKKPVPIADRFWQHVAVAGPDDCWLWTGGCYANGYGRITAVTISKGHRKMALAHRVAWQLLKGPIPEGKALCHTCDVRYPVGDITYRRCCNPAHTRPGTALMNVHDAITNKRLHTRGDKRGTGNGRSVVTEAQVLEIRARHTAGDSVTTLINVYPLKETAMRSLLDRKTWAHI